MTNIMIPWKPHATVASVLEQDGRFLLVEEEVDGHIVHNQPAGHLEPGETLIAAAIRETLEETGHDFLPTALLGVYLWHKDEYGTSFLRFAFRGEITGHDPARKLDAGIRRAVWLTHDEILTLGNTLRSPLVLRCIEDYQAGREYPLDLLTSLAPSGMPA